MGVIMDEKIVKKKSKLTFFRIFVGEKFTDLTPITENDHELLRFCNQSYLHVKKPWKKDGKYIMYNPNWKTLGDEYYFWLEESIC